MKKIIIIIIAIIVLGILIYIFNSLPVKKSTDIQTEQKTLDTQRITKEVNNGQAVLLDVRTALELEQEGYAISATHFDVKRLQEGEMPKVNKTMKIYIYCRSGKRAENAKNILENNGYTDVINIGGLINWNEAKGEIVN